MTFFDAVSRFEHSLDSYRIVAQTTSSTALFIQGNPSFRTGRIHLEIGLFLGTLDHKVLDFLKYKVGGGYTNLQQSARRYPILRMGVERVRWGEDEKLYLDDFDLETWLRERRPHACDEAILNADLDRALQLLTSPESPMNWAINPLAFHCLYAALRHAALEEDVGLHIPKLPAEKAQITERFIEDVLKRSMDEIEPMMTEWIEEISPLELSLKIDPHVFQA